MDSLIVIVSPCTWGLSKCAVRLYKGCKDRIILSIMLPCKHNAEQFIQLSGWPGSTQQAGIFADFMKVIRNWYFIQLQITCNIVIELQLQLLDLKCNSITITITELVIQLRNSITCISITEQHWAGQISRDFVNAPILASRERRDVREILSYVTRS